jgi:large subunit ribosomal protein L17
MRHQFRGRKLGRTHSHRKALLRNLVTSLLRHGRITTTVPKAKELRSVTDRMVTYAKKGTLHHRRLAARYINDAGVIATLFGEYATRFATRPGGYTRIMKLGARKGDAAEMAVIELMPAAAGAVDTTAAVVTSKEAF